MPKAKTDFNNYRYQQGYLKANYKWVNLGFNQTKPEAMKMYEWLDEKEKTEGKTKYIKRLIREDMERVKFNQEGPSE